MDNSCPDESSLFHFRFTALAVFWFSIDLHLIAPNFAFDILPLTFSVFIHLLLYLLQTYHVQLIVFHHPLLASTTTEINQGFLVAPYHRYSFDTLHPPSSLQLKKTLYF